jgi:hypothetical protein
MLGDPGARCVQNKCETGGRARAAPCALNRRSGVG